ncbi:MAG: M16 family metallopeptidase [Flavobacteriales bacterium]
MNKPKIHFTILLFFIIPSLFAQLTKKEGQHGKYRYTYFENDPYVVRKYVLSNGLTVYLSRNDDEPSFQSYISVRAGSKHDPADNTGLAHYLEHMLFKGTDQYGTINFEKEKPLLDEIDALYERYNNTTDKVKRGKFYQMIDSLSQLASQYSIANEYDRLMQHLGAVGTNAYTWFEETVYVNVIPSNQIENWLKIEAERFRNPVLRIFHTELEAVYEEKNLSLNSDDSKVYEKIMADLFRNHTYGTQTTIGTVEHLKNPSLVKIREYYQKYYVPNNMAIILVGDIDYERAIAQIDEHFAYMQPREIYPLKFPKEEPRTEKRVYTILGPEAESVNIAYRLPSRRSAEYPITNMVFGLLSNGKAGLIDQNLNTSQKVLDAGSYQFSLKDHGVGFFYGNPKAGQKLEQVEQLIKEQINKLKSGDFDERLIRAVADNYALQNMEGMESNGGRTNAINEAFINELDWADIIQVADLMQKITKVQIQEYAQKYFNEDHVVIYKKTGEDKNIEQIEKPKITPINLNRDLTSRFAKTVMTNKVEPLQPEFLDFKTQLRRKEIKPGVELFTVRNSRNQLFKLYYVFEFGKLSDKYLGHAAELLELFGMEGMDANAVKKEFYMLACNFNVFASNEQMFVMLSGPQKNFEPAVQLMEKLMSSVQADKKVYKEYVGRVVQERKDNLLNQNMLSSALRSYAFYGKLNPNTFILNNKELKKAKPEVFTTKIKDLPSYEHAIIYYGPLRPDAVEVLVRNYHKLPENIKEKPVNAKFEFQEYAQPIVYTAHFDMVTSSLNWVKRSADFTKEKQPMARLYNEYFGGGMSSVVFQTIRESKALAYSSYASFVTPTSKSNPFTFFAFIGTQADKTIDAIHAMNQLIDELPESEQSFSTAVKSIKTGIETQRFKRERVVFNYLSLRRLGLDYDVRKDVYEQVDKSTFADLKDFHDTYVKSKTGAYAILGSNKRLDKNKLGQFGRVIELKPKDLFNY